MSLTAMILAAGRSTRMNTRRAKAMHEICGKPILGWLLDACFAASVTRVVLVVGYAKEQIIGQFGSDPRISFVEQADPMGTGHSAKMGEAAIHGQRGDVLILAGDAPLIRPEILTTLLRAHREEDAAASMATVELEDPTGYGRIVRDSAGEFVEIVEQLDCTPEQREIHEVFPSIYCVRIADLTLALSKLKNENKKHEYYLTDIYGILRQEGRKVLAVQAAMPEDVVSPNTRQQLAEADAVMQDRLQRKLRESGVTIVSGEQTYVEANVTAGPDTVIQPFVFIGRDTTIGPDCVIGPFASLPRGSLVPEGTRLMGISPA